VMETDLLAKYIEMYIMSFIVAVMTTSSNESFAGESNHKNSEH